MAFNLYARYLTICHIATYEYLGFLDMLELSCVIGMLEWLKILIFLSNHSLS